MAEASSTSIPRERTVLSILRCPSWEPNGAKIAGAPIDEDGFRAPQRMGAAEPGIQADTGDPSGTSRAYCLEVLAGEMRVTRRTER